MKRFWRLLSALLVLSLCGCASPFDSGTTVYVITRATETEESMADVVDETEANTNGISEAEIIIANTEEESSEAENSTSVTGTYVLNTSSKKFHHSDCASAGNIKEENRQEFTGTREELLALGYAPCKRCNP